VAITADSGAFQDIVARLTDDAASVRREAARALGRLRQPGATGALANAIMEARDDAVLTHALIYALIEINRPDEVRELLARAHPLARRAALIVLDQISPGDLTADPVVKALRSSDPSLRDAATDIAVKNP
jgi:HEAT repeat protein